MSSNTIKDLFNVINKGKVAHQNYRDDFVDGLSYRFASSSLMLSAVLIIAKQYVMEPISCYLATAANKEDMMDYIEDYCFVEGTIPISYNMTLPTNDLEWNNLEKVHKTKYYQWVPLMLMVQALMFYVPHLTWKLLNASRRGMEMKSIIGEANKVKNLDRMARKSHVLRLMKALECLLFEVQGEKKKGFKNVMAKVSNVFLLSKRSGLQMLNFYIFIKLLYIVNIVLQLYMMNKFLSWDRHEKSMLGYGVIKDILSGKNWKETLVFPRVAYCLVPLRTMADTVYTLAQCALPVNMLNEKIYVFLWIFFTLILIIATVSFIQTVVARIRYSNQKTLILRHLRLNEEFKETTQDTKTLLKFQDRLLLNDGLHLLDVLSKESGDVITGEVVMQMWEKFKNNSHEIDTTCVKKLCQNRPRAQESAPLLHSEPNEYDGTLVAHSDSKC